MKQNGQDRKDEPLLSPLAADFTLFSGRDAVLLIHGFTGSPAHMLPLGRALQQAGFTVRGLRLKGHGTSLEDMQQASWRDWLNEAKEAFDELASAFQTVSVAGLSMGGVLSLLLAEEKGPACCVTLSAPMAVTNPFSRLAPLLRFAMPVLNKKNSEEKKLLDAEYDIGYDRIPTAKVADLTRLITMARESLSKVTCPLLAVQSLGDHTISSDSAETIVSKVSSPVRERLTLDMSPHVITIGPEQDKLLSAVPAFILKQIKKEE